MDGEILFSDDRVWLGGKDGDTITVEVSGITREVTLQDLLAFAGNRGLGVENVKVTPECDCDGGCCSFPNRHIELSWKAK